MTALVFSRVSYTREEAAKATGVSVSVIDQARKNGDLVAHYVGSKPVYRAVELDAWVASLPTESARKN